MDHFNVTVQKNGTLVSTRRGLQVSKHKYHGISFVNTSGPGEKRAAKAGVLSGLSGAGSGKAAVAKAGTLPHRWKFVTRPGEKAVEDDDGKDKEASRRARKPRARRRSEATMSAASVLTASTVSTASTPPQTTPSPPLTTLSPAASAPFRIPMLDETEQRVFDQYFPLVPRKIYPFEELLQYNPARSREFYTMVVQDPAAVRCVLLCGAMFRAVLGGTDSAAGLAGEVAHVCRIVSEQLDQLQLGADQTDQTNQTGRADRVASTTSTLECITTLALMGGFTGRYDHWHVHMRGLTRLVALQAGGDGPEALCAAFGRLRPSLQTKMRKTDLKGAMALGTAPYLPFARTCANASDAVVAAVDRAGVAAAVAALLAPFGEPVANKPLALVSPYSLEDDYDYDYDYDYSGLYTYTYSSGFHHTHYGYAYGGAVRAPVVDAVVQLCVFARAVRLARARLASPAPVRLDPFGFAEELHWLQHALVSQPAALREPDHHHYSSSSSSGCNGLVADTPAVDDLLHHNQALTLPLPVPAAHDSTDGTPVSFLEPALRICGLLYLKELIPDFPRNLGGYGVLLHLLRTHLRPSLWFDVDTAAAATASQLLVHPRARAVLLWVCLLGDAVSRIADANERRGGAARYDRRVFHARLVELVRSADASTDVHAVVAAASLDPLDPLARLPDTDWALCRLLDLASIRPGCEDDRHALLHILAEGDAPGLVFV